MIDPTLSSTNPTLPEKVEPSSANLPTASPKATSLLDIPVFTQSKQEQSQRLSALSTEPSLCRSDPQNEESISLTNAQESNAPTKYDYEFSCIYNGNPF